MSRRKLHTDMLTYTCGRKTSERSNACLGHRTPAEPCFLSTESQIMSASKLMSIRLIHHYTGVFFAPTILFFAMAGGLQMFGLHETSRGSSYVPPAILVHLSQLHKKGTLYLPSRKAIPPTTVRPDGPKPETPRPDGPKTPGPSPAAAYPNPLPMKIFFAATALALVLSTCTGLFMSWRYARRKAIVVGVFFAGIACPLILLLL